MNYRTLLRDFGTTEKCLAYLVKRRWPGGIPCETCGRVTKYYPVKGRKAYACQHCGRHVYPTKGTVMHGSKVPLPDWFYVIFHLSQTRAGISAKQIERELEVSYPTALRMCNLIRSALGENPALGLLAPVEADETYIGGRPRRRGVSKAGRGTKKVPVIGAVERGGKVVVRAVDDVKKATVLPFLRQHVIEGSAVYTDEYGIYRALPKEGYGHEVVQHKEREYVRVVDDGGPFPRSIHTNNLEGFWSYPKSAVLHVHRGVSRHRLQGYLNEHAFRYNHRKDPEGLFFALLNRVSGPRATPTASVQAPSVP